MNKFILYIAFALFTFGVHAQSTDEQLADYYFNEGDCQKAIPYFEKVYAQKPVESIYNRYLSCLREVGSDKDVIQLISQQAARYPRTPKYQVAVGREYEKQNNEKRAQKIYQDLIQNLSPSPNEIIYLQRAFQDVGKHNLALETLEHGRQIMRNYPFNLQFAEVYGAMNETEKMIKEYIDLLDENPNMLSTLKMILPRNIDFTEEEENNRFVTFQRELIKKIQKNPDNKAFSELLIWALLQRKNFAAALIQAKGLDRRTTNDGREVFIIGNQALTNHDFPSARSAFKYIVELGDTKPYYYGAEQLLLNTRYQEITALRNYSQEQIEETIKEYKNALMRMPKNGKTLPIVRELAYIQAYYGNQPLEASKILDSVLLLPRYTDLEEAKTKLLLADIKVLLNDIWEASLLYMQVEKKFKYEPIGEEAKFKNAQIFYYDGDFKFAQSQLDVLKEATTRLIANDAMKLSFFITDNLGLDSNYYAMRKFAEADLLLKQHQFERAFQLYDSITDIFPNHKLADDILMRKAQASMDKGEWDKAITLFQKVAEDYNQDILADDALYQIAKIYENHLFDDKKAAEYYFIIMRDYPGSLFVTEARKAYRKIN